MTNMTVDDEAMELDEGIIKRSNLSNPNPVPTNDLDPLHELEFWNSIIVPEEDKLMDIPEELLDLEGLPPILDYKSVMQNLQKTIAVEHARKVREGKESVSMNAQLREKYSDYNYHFPDRILNSGLSKKDFTAPFLIDVGSINQDMGKPQHRARLQGETPSLTDVIQEALDKPFSSTTTITTNSHNNSIRNSIGPNNNNNSNSHNLHQQLAAAKKRDLSSAAAANVEVSLGNKPTVNIRPSSAAANVIASSPTLFAMLEQPAPKRPKLGEPSRSLPPPPPQTIRVLARGEPHMNRSNNNMSQMNNNMEVDEDKDTSDDFFPKIVNTVGSFQINESSSDKQQQQQQQQRNGASAPKLIKIQPRLKVSGEAGSGNNVAVVRSQQHQSDHHHQQQQQQDGQVKKVKSVRGSGYLGCRTCGKTFPSNCDNLYRSHMLIKHGQEVSDADIFNSKIQVTSWYKCKKCNLMVLNNLEEHQKKCLPGIPFNEAFTSIHVLKDNVAKIQCGVCNESFGSRVGLRQHLQTKHPAINNRILIDPFFRCGLCLLNFTDAKKLIEHVHICSAPSPSADTCLEIAQKNLYCEICARKHSKIRETLFCYQVKSLLRCVLCMHVCQSRQNFFQHLKTFHNRRQTGLCCPFCNDETEKQTREAFDHFIDNHFNVALKKAGEAAAASSTSATTSTTTTTTPNTVNRVARIPHVITNNSQIINSLNSSTTITPTISANANRVVMPKLVRPMVQGQGQLTATALTASQVVGAKRPLPTLKPKSILPRVPMVTTASGQVIQVPASQVLQMNPSSGINLMTTNGTLFTTGNLLTRPVIINRAQLSNVQLSNTNMPLQFSVIPASSLATASTSNSGNNVRPIKIASVTSGSTTTTTTTPVVPILPAPQVSASVAASTSASSAADEDSILGM